MIPESLAQYDFRSNLIADADNPVLIQKAWRDHFAGQRVWQPGKAGGKAYLGVANSEDALTWNVVRSLQLAGPEGLRILSDAADLAPVGTVLFWGCDVEGRSDVQQLLSILLRTVDGQLKGTMTEPDLVLITTEEVAFVECKLNLNGMQSPWKAQQTSADKESGAARRMKSYIGSGFTELDGITDWEDIYQLVRQYVYATRLAQLLGRRPAVIPLVNGDHLSVLQPLYERAQTSSLNRDHIFRNILTWQAISERVASSGLPCAATLVLKMTKAIEASRGRRTSA